MYSNEIYNVYSFKLMQYLDKCGFKFIATKQQEECPTKTIFRYIDTPELREAVKKYTDACKEFFGDKGDK